MSQHVTQAEFARMEGKARSYITALKNAGRLVLAADGKVDVEQSRSRIAETADPNRDDVASRWSASRGAATSPPSAPSDGADRIGNSYQTARAVKEKFNAMQAKLDYERAIGKLVERGEMIALIADVATTLRAGVETLPDRLAPSLAAIADESHVRAMLAEHVEMILTDLSTRFAAIARDAE